KLVDVGNWLAHELASLSLGLEYDSCMSAQFMIREAVAERTVQRIIAPVEGAPSLVSVQTNVQYEIKANGHFILRPKFDSKFKTDNLECLDYAGRVVSALNALVED